MFVTVLFFGAFLLAFASLFLMRKSQKKLNGTSWLVIAMIAVICISGLLAGIVGVFRIPINLLTMSLVYLAMGIAGVLKILHDKEIQKYEWHVFDVICMILFAAVVFVIGGKLYGGELAFCFKNSDSAVHFENAMYIVRNQKLSGMYFASLYSATLIEAMSPFVKAVNYFKIFIVADNLALLAEVYMFFVLIREYLDKAWKKVVGVILTLAYLGGYPLMGYELNFFYWGIAVMIIAFIMLMVRYYRTREIERGYSVFFMMVGCGCVFLCYMMFAPITYIAVLLSLIAVAKKEGKVFTKSNVLLAFKVFLFPCLIGFWYCRMQWFIKSGMKVKGVIATNGGIYSELYINFVLMLPFIFYWLIRRWKEKECPEELVFMLCFAAFTFLLFLFMCENKVSTYYYYKMYYPLWILFFFIVLKSVFELFERQREMLLSLTLVIVFLGGVSVGKVEEWLMQNTIAIPANHSNQFFDIYYYNWAGLKAGGNYDGRLLELCEYTMEEFEDEDVTAPILVDALTCGYAYWYDAITGKHSYEYYGWWYSIEEIQAKLEAEECDYMVVMTFTALYQDNQEYFDSFDRVMENDIGFIIDVAGK